MFATLHNLKNKINFREESFKGIVFVLQIVQAWWHIFDPIIAEA